MEAKWYNVSYNKCLEDQEEISEVDWIIPDYKLLVGKQSNREFTYSTDAESSQEPYCTFQFKIRICGNYDFIQIYYRTLVNVYLKCSLTAKNKAEENTKDITKDYDWVEANKWQLLLTLPRVFTDRYLRLKFDFRINITSVHYQTIGDEEGLNNTSNSQLNTDLEKFLFDPLLSDVTIKSAEGDEMPAHKLLLISRSAVLKAHFEHDTVERSTNIVETPFETEVLKEVLNYIYTDKVPKLDQMAKKLLAAGDYYQLSGLKGICEKALHKQLTVENAIDTLALATLYTATKLKDLTVKFINDGNAKEVIQTKAWKTLQSTEVIKSIYEYSIINN